MWRWFTLRFLCEILGWHRVVLDSDQAIGYSINIDAYCSRCGYEGMLDSQGNLF